MDAEPDDSAESFDFPIVENWQLLSGTLAEVKGSPWSGAGWLREAVAHVPPGLLNGESVVPLDAVADQYRSQFAESLPQARLSDKVTDLSDVLARSASFGARERPVWWTRTEDRRFWAEGLRSDILEHAPLESLTTRELFELAGRGVRDGERPEVARELWRRIVAGDEEALAGVGSSLDEAERVEQLLLTYLDLSDLGVAETAAHIASNPGRANRVLALDILTRVTPDLVPAGGRLLIGRNLLTCRRQRSRRCGRTSPSTPWRNGVRPASTPSGATSTWIGCSTLSCVRVAWDTRRPPESVATTLWQASPRHWSCPG